MTTVVAAIIRRNGRILICRRRADQLHPLKWEFPGGKVEAGEVPADALRRELAEELGIQARIASEITRYEYAYSGRPPILLVFFEVPEIDGEPRNLGFAEMRWEEPARLRDYDFLEGDLDFVRGLAG